MARQVARILPVGGSKSPSGPPPRIVHAPPGICNYSTTLTDRPPQPKKYFPTLNEPRKHKELSHRHAPPLFSRGCSGVFSPSSYSNFNAEAFLMQRIRTMVVSLTVFGIGVAHLAGQQAGSGISSPDNAVQQGASLAAGGTVPRLIKFSGAVRESNGKVPGGTVTLTFSLYALQQGGSPLWSETQSASLDAQGNYVVLLGATLPAGLPQDLFSSGQALWLGVQPQLSGVGELPRVLLVAVPYALKASDSDTLGGKPASAYALAGSPILVEPTGGAASTTPNPPGSNQDATAGSASSPQPLVTACTAVTSDGTATAGTVAKFTTACNVENSLLRDNGTGVAVGGTSAPGALFDVQFNSSAATGTLQGQRVLTTLNPAAASSASAYGIFSDATDSQREHPELYR